MDSGVYDVGSMDGQRGHLCDIERDRHKADAARKAILSRISEANMAILMSKRIVQTGASG